MRLGLSVRGSRMGEHRGRVSGDLHHTPVNPLALNGMEYLIAPRGDTQWVRNVRAADGHLVLILGRRRQQLHGGRGPGGRPHAHSCGPTCVRWKFEVGMFFDGVGPDSSRRGIRRHRRTAPGLRPALSTAHG